MTRVRHYFIGLVVLVVAMSSGCSAEKSVSAEEARDYAARYLIGRRAGVSGTALYRTLSDLLPNTSYVEIADAEPPIVPNNTVAVGQIINVEHGVGFYGNGPEHPATAQVPFGDERAEWNTIHVTVDVQRVIGSDAEPPQQLRVGLPAGPDVDFERLSLGLRSLGDVVLFMYKSSPVFAYDQSLFAVLEDSIIATVAGDGSLALPFVESGRAEKMLQETPTLDALATQAQQPPRTIRYEKRGEDFRVRAD